MTHPPPDIKTKKPCVRVVRKALSMIDISREDSKKDQEHSWWWRGELLNRHLVKDEGSMKVGCRLIVDFIEKEWAYLGV